ncbi:hypothetical protein Cni_G09094 [Canna indica]|uniref:Transcription repressor n=1 Tax=Canna indica TaxID=4628 RepID=A0AAQ3Q681_9LILI|nr:hypothetical protein Cni_G09094 [Canna indica]
MSTQRSKLAAQSPAAVDVGCSCRRPKLPSFFSPSPKPNHPGPPSLRSPSTTTWESSRASVATANSSSSSSSSSRNGNYTSSLSPELYPPETATSNHSAASGARKGALEGSVAVAIESSDPYVDFRDSMLQMVVEMEIYAWEDLCDLLHRFLTLNAPRYHHVIFRAFSRVYRVLFSASGSSAAASTSVSTPHRCR